MKIPIYVVAVLLLSVAVARALPLQMPPSGSSDDETEVVPQRFAAHIKTESERAVVVKVLRHAKAAQLDTELFMTSLGRLVTTLVSFRLSDSEVNEALGVFCRALGVTPLAQPLPHDFALPWSEPRTADAEVVADVAALRGLTAAEFVGLLQRSRAHETMSVREFTDAYGGAPLQASSVAEVIEALGSLSEDTGEGVGEVVDKTESQWREKMSGSLFDYQRRRWQDFCSNARASLEGHLAAVGRPNFVGHVGGGALAEAMERAQDLVYGADLNANVTRSARRVLAAAVRQLQRRKRVVVIGAEGIDLLGIDGSAEDPVSREFERPVLVDTSAPAAHQELLRVGGESGDLINSWTIVAEDVSRAICPLLFALHRAAIESASVEAALQPIREVLMRFHRVPFNAPRHIVSVRDADLVVFNDALASFAPAVVSWTYHHLRETAAARGETNLPDFMESRDTFSRLVREEAEFLAEHIAGDFVRALAADVPEGSVVVFFFATRSCIETTFADEGKGSRVERLNCFRAPGDMIGATRAFAAGGDKDAITTSFVDVDRRRRQKGVHSGDDGAVSAKGVSSFAEVTESRLLTVRRGPVRAVSPDDVPDFGDDVRLMIEEEERRRTRGDATDEL